MSCYNIKDFTIIAIKGIDYCCIAQNMSISDAIHLLKNSAFDDGEYI